MHSNYKRNPLKKYIYIFSLISVFLLSGCNNEDNVEGIFTGKDWKLAFVDTGEGRLSAGQNVYLLTFTEQLFSLTTPSSAIISGNWVADGNSRSFVCSNVKISSGSISSDTLAQRVKSYFEKAQSYEGDDNTIKIFTSEGTYMQFYSKQL